MEFGVVFPQTQLGADISVLRDFTQAAEDMGFHHILAYDHVLGANPDRPGWEGRRPYTYNDMFHEPFTLFSWMAAFTARIGFMTGVIILPQRQTALAAKQAAQVDLLSGGRLRLGIGVGWNDVEYTCLGEDFATRGARVEEQMHILRQLWTRELVSISGRFDTIDDAGINPLPVQRPIPIWIGGTADIVLRRAARLSDGYVAQGGDPASARATVERYWQHADEAGRRESLGLHARLSSESVNEDLWLGYVEGWRELGATDLAIYPHGDKLEDYLAVMDRFRMMAA